jgi:hypothetical protein
LLYSKSLLPEWLLLRMVKHRLQLQGTSGEADPGPAQADTRARDAKAGGGDGDATSGVEFDDAILSSHRLNTIVSSILSRQLAHCGGFVTAYINSMRYAPIFSQQLDWRALGLFLSTQRKGAVDRSKRPPVSLIGNKVFLVLGKNDPTIPMDEILEDTIATLGEDGIESVIMNGGHELPITMSTDVSDAVGKFLTG